MLLYIINYEPFMSLEI